MEKTLDVFKSQQSRVVAVLEELSAFLQQGESFGIQIDPHLRDKLATAIAGAGNEKLKIALIGGFSEGKTSIAAAWMEKLDKSSMNISHQESSNEVRIYDVGNDYVLIDTPGLFGFKEQVNEDTHAIEKYKDITKKYVSEAHLVLYVMNSTNPVKESHKEDLNWLFRTLDLLPRTVFVLSRFDEVVDVEDEEAYRAALAIKRDNVTGRLESLIALNGAERENLSIVAVAANPFDMGTEHWLQNLESFKALSHIDRLQQATSVKIKQNGGPLALVGEMKKSIIRDVLSKQLPVAIENDENIAQEVNGLETMSQRAGQQLDAISRQISTARIALREFISRYFTDLILQTRGLSMETFNDFFEREVGSEGCIVAARLQNEFDRQLQSVTLAIDKMQTGFNADVNHFNNALMSYGRQGISYVVKSNMITNTTVLAARNGIVSVAKTVGVDLSKLLKFKPWGAVNLAKGVNGALAFVSLGMELWDSWSQIQKEQEFAKALDTMVKNFEAQREHWLKSIDSESFVTDFFNNYIVLHEKVVNLQQSVSEGRARQQQFKEWRKKAEAIDAEFTVLSH
ncbi:LeoA/HP0731 family dynamin-like GTPase [Erwinia sorbitola]|uniref:Labile enterotoxin output A n=1 Tax=Erwinia sorbitola TaxID=2681984 RepID=A0A6I6EV26_9GAMM|nr:LeoA/HP0731 family dynamin-like GTPase [Erwinia sorbitola]MTD28182.1 labile enterotoxin output A [Erwinia sorbitola]QGU85870.1 labile enterotoxin output A [Erwinia sorbitola]